VAFSFAGTAVVFGAIGRGMPARRRQRQPVVEDDPGGRAGHAQHHRAGADDPVRVDFFALVFDQLGGQRLVCLSLAS